MKISLQMVGVRRIAPEAVNGERNAGLVFLLFMFLEALPVCLSAGSNPYGYLSESNDYDKADEYYPFSPDYSGFESVMGNRVKVDPREARKEAMYRMAARLGLPYKELDHGLSAVRDSLSYGVESKQVRFSTRFIVDWGEVGILANIGGWGGFETKMELSNRHQGLIISKEYDYVSREITIDAESVMFRASIPIEELSFRRVLSSINIFGFFTNR